MRASINKSATSRRSKLTKLDRLEPRSHEVSDLKPLAKLKNLTELQLDDTQVLRSLSAGGLTALETSASSAHQVADALPLKNLKKLKFIYINAPARRRPHEPPAAAANGTKISAD